MLNFFYKAKLLKKSNVKMEKDKRGKLLPVSFSFSFIFSGTISNVRVARPCHHHLLGQSWTLGHSAGSGTLKLPLQYHRACQETLTAMGMSPRQPEAGQAPITPCMALVTPYRSPFVTPENTASTRRGCHRKRPSNHRTGRTLPAPGKTPHFTFA